ncbi:hypothetical protein KKC13_09355 [bacterium]|nr:hypothetical protein [bacterium]MBU1957826.1 hypothetical protein [bacterium]
MKNIKSLLLLVGLISTSITTYADDYALINSYPLFTDMKTVSKQQTTLEHMSNIVMQENKDQETFQKLEAQFEQTIEGLAHGDKARELKGTNISELRRKLSRIQIFWKKEKTTVHNALTNNRDSEQALASLHKLSIKIEQLNTLYKKSYTRYKQRSILGSIVKRHMNTKEASTQQILVLNTIQ